jgi:hypothetical protein
MLGKRFRHRKNTGARPEPNPRSPRGQCRQALIKLGKAFDRGRTVTFRHGIKRRVDLDILIEAAGDTAQADDLGSDRKSGHELCAL